MYNALILLLLLLALSSTVLTQIQGVTCSFNKPCPLSSPCCSEFGFCGSGTHCLGGCNPLLSHNLTSCKPQPICQNSNLVFTDSSRILPIDDYDGNATQYDWTVDKGNISISNGELVMILTEGNGGTRISSTRYLHYGTVTAKLKTGRWPGVVTAFITMSSIKDEIDWEFPGGKVTEAQTNYFWQGVVPQQTRGTTQKGLTDTSINHHEYTIDWKPDALSFSIDGRNVRTVRASEAQRNGISEYPSTPSRIQISIWPAGIKDFAQGTIDWAGGMIDWNNADYKSAGHFAIYVSSVSIKCADPTSPSGSTTSYIYGSNSTASTPDISFSDASTSLTKFEIQGGTTSSGGSTSPSGQGSDPPPGSNKNKKPPPPNGALLAGLSVGLAVGGLVLLIGGTMAVRACMRRMRSQKALGPRLERYQRQQTYLQFQSPSSSNVSFQSHYMQRRY